MKIIFLFLLLVNNAFSCDAIWKIGEGNDSGPTQLLEDIFTITKIKNNGDLRKIIKQTTFKWLRPKFMERWHYYRLLDREQKRELEKLIKSSIFTREKLPKQKHYNAVVICCGWSSVAQRRIDFLIKLHNQGITFDKIYLLGTSRSLRNGPEDERKLIPLLTKRSVLVFHKILSNNKDPAKRKATV